MDHKFYCENNDRVKSLQVIDGRIIAEFNPGYRVAGTHNKSSWECRYWIELRSIIEGLIPEFKLTTTGKKLTKNVMQD